MFSPRKSTGFHKTFHNSNVFVGLFTFYVDVTLSLSLSLAHALIGRWVSILGTRSCKRSQVFFSRRSLLSICSLFTRFSFFFHSISLKTIGGATWQSANTNVRFFLVLFELSVSNKFSLRQSLWLTHKPTIQTAR